MSLDSRSVAAASLARLLRVSGPTLAHDLRLRSGLAPATFTRTIAALRPDVLAVGATRSLTYALRRVVPGLPTAIPVYDLRPDGPTLLATLHPVEPGGFYVERQGHPLQGFTPDLPWFLHDLRPAGFLGRLVPREHPELELPADLRLWTADHALRWLHAWGLDTVGSLVVGEPAFRRLQVYTPPLVPADERVAVYPGLAESVMSRGAPGSSAGGEQPKFLAARHDGVRKTSVLVKFSPRTAEPTGRRTADLLRCEHHALTTLRDGGVPAAASTIVEAGGRVFLEVERFDRIEGGDGAAGRRGLVSLLAVAAHAGADLRDWSVTADSLAAAGVITAADHARVHLLDRFGALIGNTDRHAGNLSFFFVDGRIGALAPVYDMLPMAYAVRGGEFATPRLAPPAPTPRFAGAWQQAWALAETFWERVAVDAAIHEEMREIAVINRATLAERRAMVDRLPSG